MISVRTAVSIGGVAAALLLGLSPQSSSAQQASPPASTGKPPDYEFFKTRVQPIFFTKREGQARCIMCHMRGTGFRLAEFSPGATSWNEEQSRKNYASALRLVSPGDPDGSRLLIHPLAPEGGGDPYHNGGKKFASKNVPEWRTMAEWVRTGTAPAASNAAQVLDFEFYRTRIEPIFLNPRQGGAANTGGVPCFSCHMIMATPMRLQAVPEGTKSWSAEQSRRNFEVVARLVVPGDPANSRLLRQPLATNAGGSPAPHTGGKFWSSQDDPEYKTMAEWVSRKR